MTTPRASHPCPGPILLLSLLLAACAGKSPTPTTGGKDAPLSQRRWPGGPDARVAKLVAAAAGDQPLALGVIHGEAWTGLSRLLMSFPPFRELAGQMPWLTSEDLWQPMQMALGLAREARAPTLPALAGWDRTRPVAVAWLGSDRRGLIESIGAVLFDFEKLPIHIRVVVPATNADRLAKAFQDSFATLPGQGTPPGQYLLDLGGTSRLAVAVVPVPADDCVRLDLLYFIRCGDDLKQQNILRQLHAAMAPGKGQAYEATDPIGRLLANGHGAVLTFRPAAIAQRLLLDGPRKIVDALDSVDGTMRASLKAMGTSEVLSGYLVTATGQPEIAEMALALQFDGTLEAVTLTRLTAAGGRQMASVLRADARPLATAPEALLSASLVLAPQGAVAKLAPLFSPAYRPDSLQDLLRVVQEGGASSWLALMARPMGLWRTVQEDRQLSRELRLPATWPGETSFELFDFTDDGKAAFRVRGRLPKDVAAAALWAPLAKQVASTLGEGESNIQEEARPDATWLTWQQTIRQPAKLAMPEAASRLADEPPGTFAVVRIDGPALAQRWEGQHPGGPHGDERVLLEALRLLGHVESRTRWQDGWLIGESRAGAVDASALAPYQPTLPPPVAASEPELPPGRLSLERAVVQLRSLLSAAANVDPAMRVRLLNQGRAEFKGELTQAKRDPATLNEAMSLDGILLQLSKDFEVQEAQEANERQRRPHHVRGGSDGDSDGDTDGEPDASSADAPSRQHESPAPAPRRPHKPKRSR